MTCSVRPTVPLVLALALLGLAAGSAQAQKISPGLWEMTLSVKVHGGEMDAAMAKMQAELAKMPPEQRRQVETMMAQRGLGVGVGAGGKGMAVKTCVSKERAERGEVLDADSQRNCKRDSVTSSGSTTKFKISCSNPPSTGEGEFTLTSDKAFSGRMQMEAQVKGKPERVEMQQQGKWLSADCGTVQPK